MTALKFAFREYLRALTIKDSKPLLCWDGEKYVVSWYFSKEKVKHLGWEVIHG